MNVNNFNGQKLPSIDVILDEVRRKLDFHFEQLESLDTKAGISLGIAGVVITIAITSLLTAQTTHAYNCLLFVAIGVVLIAIALSTIKLWVKSYQRPPNIENFRDNYIMKPVNDTKLNLINICLEAIDKNKKAISWQVWLVRVADICIVLTLVLFVIWFSLNI